MTHTLKTLPQYWDAVERGDKDFEVRWNDRGFKVGDILVLCRLSARSGELDGHSIERRVKYVLYGGRSGIEAGYMVLGLEEL